MYPDCKRYDAGIHLTEPARYLFFGHETMCIYAAMRMFFDVLLDFLQLLSSTQDV